MILTVSTMILTVLVFATSITIALCGKKNPVRMLMNFSYFKQVVIGRLTFTLPSLAVASNTRAAALKYILI